MQRLLALAFLSGAPALVYELIWTRQVALAVGSQVGSISVVLAAYFGGLAAGARWLGARADRAPSPLRLYAGLEAAAALGAVAAPALLFVLADAALAPLPRALRLLVTAGLLFPVTFLLGGTLPALLRSASPRPHDVARAAGGLVAANTAGAVAGVVVATLCIPRFGLRATLAAAASLALGVAVAAWGLARRQPPRRLEPAAAEPGESPAPIPVLVLAAAFLAGTLTLAYEVLTARAAALQLGSSLYAWAAVLALFLLGLALGNALFARRAATTSSPAAELGWIESAAALAIAGSSLFMAPALGLSATGLRGTTLARVGVAVLVPALLMGAAFPFLVRLGVREGRSLGARFGAVSGINTAGGIAGSLLAPFVLLPALGLRGALAACVAGSALLGVGFLASAAPSPRAGVLRAGFAAAVLAGLAGAALSPRIGQDPGSVLFVEHGRDASAVVIRTAQARHLFVDGDPEASTSGNARETEELLAALPLLLHPAPRSFLEIGLGSGITLGAATRFDLERIDCVEIAGSVIRAARFFEPDNGSVISSPDRRLRIVHDDGRALVARQQGRYDVIVANTVHPWSVAATGLYSQEYYARIARALRPGGLAAQWVPVERLGAVPLAGILRTFLGSFPDGGVWWGGNELILIGGEHVPDHASERPLSEPAAALVHRLGLAPPALRARRLASRDIALAALGPGPLLSDDRPRLELDAARRRAGRDAGGELALIARIAEAGARADPAAGPIGLYVQSLAARRAGDLSEADALERVAAAGGLVLARRARVERAVDAAVGEAEAGRLAEAESALRLVLREQPEHPGALRALALALLQRADVDGARPVLERLVAAHPDHAEAWNLLGRMHLFEGRGRAAREAFERTLRADPFVPDALLHAGLLAAEAGDCAGARERLGQLGRMSPLAERPEERRLREELRIRGCGG